MIALLVVGKEKLRLGGHYIILQLAHHMEIASRNATQLFMRLTQRIFGRHFERHPLLGIIATQYVDSRNLAERIDKSGSVTRYHVEIARSGLYVREEARPVHPFAACEDAVEIGLVVDDEIKGLETSVGSRITKIYHLYAVLANIAHQIGLGEIPPRLTEKTHETVRV